MTLFVQRNDKTRGVYALLVSVLVVGSCRSFNNRAIYLPSGHWTRNSFIKRWCKRFALTHASAFVHVSGERQYSSNWKATSRSDLVSELPPGHGSRLETLFEVYATPALPRNDCLCQTFSLFHKHQDRYYPTRINGMVTLQLAVLFLVKFMARNLREAQSWYS